MAVMGQVVASQDVADFVAWDGEEHLECGVLPYFLHWVPVLVAVEGRGDHALGLPVRLYLISPLLLHLRLTSFAAVDLVVPSVPVAYASSPADDEEDTSRQLPVPLAGVPKIQVALEVVQGDQQLLQVWPVASHRLPHRYLGP